MDFKHFRVYFILAFLIYVNDGAKILGIFPLAGKSHFTCNNAIMKSLIDAGHEVTVITPFPEQASAQNYTSIIDISKNSRSFVGVPKIEEFIMRDVFTLINMVTEMEHPICSEFLKLPEIQRILQSNEKLYDVVFVEIIFIYKCFFPVAEKMKVPVIGTVTITNWVLADYAIHNSNHPAYIDFPLTLKWYSDHILGRIINVWNYAVIKWQKDFALPRMIRQFHEEHAHLLGSLGEYMEMEPDLIFFNNHPSLLSRPMNPNAIDIGGIHTKNVKPLPQNIQKFIDEADHGVILFSLGSVVRAAGMTLAERNAFRDAFAEIPQRVIWKFEEKIENLSSNVMTLDWLPQLDILDHKNVIAFISHCGMGALNEAINTATPIVACPLFGDQYINARLLDNRGVAAHLNFFEVTKENVLSALNEIINDTRYYNNMQLLSKHFKDRPMTQQQSVVYWTEYVIRHNGTSHLKSPASRLSWIQYFLLDVISVVVLCLILIVYLIYRLFKYVQFHLLRYLNTSKKSKNKKL